MAFPVIRTDDQTGEIVKLSNFDQGLTEAAYYQELDHPNIIKVNSITFDPTAIYRIEIRMTKYLRLNEISVDLSRLIPQMVDALAYLEANNILHNDIKPENILAMTPERYLLIDFGVATRSKVCHQARLGTVTTVAPEISYRRLLEKHYRGPIPGPFKDTFDSRSDIFSLGATLYLLITGQPWFGQRLYDKMAAQQSYSEPDDIVELLEEALSREYLSNLNGSPWKTLITRMMDPNAENRPDAFTLAKELGIDKAYTMMKIPVVRYPSNWTKQQVASIGPELRILHKFISGREDYEYLEKNALYLVLIFCSIRDVPTLKIPSYLYAALAITVQICPHGENQLDYYETQEYLRLWHEGLGDPNGFYSVFPADWNQMDFKFDPNEVIIEMASALEFRTLIEF